MSLRLTAEDDYVHAPWTPLREEALIATASRLAEGIKTHASQLVEIGTRSVVSDDDWDTASQTLRGLLKAYGDALFEYTGSFDPISNVYPMQDVTEAEELEEDAGREKIVTILQRIDYRITDENRVLTAGIEAELENSPGSTLEQVIERVPAAVPQGLYAISHASPTGWSALNNTEGIQPIVSVTLVKLADCPASVDGIGDLPDVFDLDQTPVLFSQVDEY